MPRAREDELSTSEVQELIYKRRVEEVERLGGLDRSKAKEKANDPENYRELP